MDAAEWNKLEATIQAERPLIKRMQELEAERDALKAQLADLHKYLTERAKRSNYPWSDGPDYNDHDHRFEGEILCAREALRRMDEVMGEK